MSSIIIFFYVAGPQLYRIPRSLLDAWGLCSKNVMIVWKRSFSLLPSERRLESERPASERIVQREGT